MKITAATLGSLTALAISLVECANQRMAAYESRKMYEIKAASADTCWTEFAGDAPREGE